MDRFFAGVILVALVGGLIVGSIPHPSPNATENPCVPDVREVYCRVFPWACVQRPSPQPPTTPPITEPQKCH